MSLNPLTDLELEERLAEILWSELSSLSGVSKALAELKREQQDFALNWVKALEGTHSACAFHFANHVSTALAVLERVDVEAWVLHAMDVYDHSGLHAAVEVFRKVDVFREQRRVRQVGVEFQEASLLLERFITGLSGRRLKLETADECYTDTETLYLPAITSLFHNRDDNFRLLKSTAVYLWAQMRFGTWRRDAIESLVASTQASTTLRRFQTLESLRLHAGIARELPGIYRDMMSLNQIRGQSCCPPGWDIWLGRLQRPNASVQDTLAILLEFDDLELAPVEPLCYQGAFFPDRVEVVLHERLADEKSGLQSLLVRMADDLKTDDSADVPVTEKSFSVREIYNQDTPEGFTLELLLHDQPVAPPEDVKLLLQSILLDLGEIPDEYLSPAGDGSYVPRLDKIDEDDPSTSVWSGTYHEHGAHLYDEWDFRRQHYRKNWCVLRELEVGPQADTFIAETLEKYVNHLTSLRKTFEALRGEDKRLKKESYGDEVDLDALVQAYADAATGVEMTDRLFTRRHKVDRNLAVMFMVDMSGSTRGWINEAERESLVLLCEALETLGDRYAIYGFSGMTRKRCEVYRVKEFADPYDNQVRQRIAGIQPKDYTRMGVAIRHLSGLLNQVDAKTRVLITLSDGKPDDYNDEYRGEYGIEDTRRALIEAKRTGIHPFCITIDREGQDYLPHMYGPVNYTIVDTVEKLPYKVSEIYRRLTT